MRNKDKHRNLLNGQRLEVQFGKGVFSESFAVLVSRGGWVAPGVAGVSRGGWVKLLASAFYTDGLAGPRDSARPLSFVPPGSRWRDPRQSLKCFVFTSDPGGWISI